MNPLPENNSYTNYVAREQQDMFGQHIAERDGQYCACFLEHNFVFCQIPRGEGQECPLEQIYRKCALETKRSGDVSQSTMVCIAVLLVLCQLSNISLKLVDTASGPGICFVHVMLLQTLALQLSGPQSVFLVRHRSSYHMNELQCPDEHRLHEEQLPNGEIPYDYDDLSLQALSLIHI